MHNWREFVDEGVLARGDPRHIDYLDSRTEKMSPKEWRQLEAALHMNAVSNVSDVVDITYNLPCFDVYFPATDFSTLGKTAAMHGASIPEDKLRFIDFEQVGRQMLEERDGVFIGNCFVRQMLNPEFMDRPTQKNPDDDPADRDFGVKLRIQAPNGKAAWIRLPDYEDVNGGIPCEITMALDEIGAALIGECTVVEAECILPQVKDLLWQYDDIEKLALDGANLGYVLDEQDMGRPDFGLLLEKALEYEQCDRLDFALDIATNLRCYDYQPADPDSLVEYGKKLDEDNRLGSALLQGCIDFESMAIAHLRGMGMQRMGDSFFRRNGTEFLYEHSEPPQDHSQTMSI